MIVYFIYLKKVSLLDKIKIKSEISLFIILLSTLIVAIAFVGGPEVTGKNFNRLSNLSYIVLLFLINYIFNDKLLNLNFNIFKKLLLILFFFLWSSHPTFSIFSFFQNLKFIFV